MPVARKTLRRTVEFVSVFTLLLLGFSGTIGGFGCGLNMPGNTVTAPNTGVNIVPGVGSPQSPVAPSGAPIPTGGGPTSIEESGAGAAPPISLPAPVTGRLVLTTPSQSAALMIGDVGAFSPNSPVMAVNESRAQVVNFRHLLDALIQSAWADDPLPPICSQPYHDCAYSQGDGSVELPLKDSQVGDNVKIGHIDQTGDWAGAPVTRTIPPNVRALPRPVNDIAYVGTPTMKGVVYSLMSKTNSDPKGLVEIYDTVIDSAIYASFNGPHPDRLGVNSANSLAAITDPEANTLSVVKLDTANFGSPVQADVQKPTDVVMRNNGGRVIVTVDRTMPSPALISVFSYDKPTNSLVLTQTISESDLSVLLGSGASVVTTRAIDHLDYKVGAVWYELYAFVGIYHANTGGVWGDYAYVVFASDTGSMVQVLSMYQLPPGTQPVDIAFDAQSDLFVTDAGNNKILHVDLNILGPPDPSNIHVAGVTEVPESSPNMINRPGFIACDGKLDGKVGFAWKQCYVTNNDGDATKPDSVLTLQIVGSNYEVTKRSDGGLRLTGIAVPYHGNDINLSSARSHSDTKWKRVEISD